MGEGSLTSLLVATAYERWLQAFDLVDWRLEDIDESYELLVVADLDTCVQWN